MSKKYLLSYKDNYADEFNVEGFQLMTEGDLENFKSKAIKCFDELGGYDFCIGSNETLRYDDHADFMSYITIKEISDIEYYVMRTVLDSFYFGFFPDIHDFYDEHKD